MGEANNTFNYTLNAKPPHGLSEVAFLVEAPGTCPPGPLVSTLAHLQV